MIESGLLSFLLHHRLYALTVAAALLLPGCAETANTPMNTDAQLGTTQAERLCDRLSEVRVLPFRDEPVDDAVYNRLKNAGDDAVPCLVGAITNTRETKDPRKAPSHNRVTIGDVAFWIVVDIAKLPYDDLFPEDVRRRFKDEGIDAYFDWVKTPTNRALLQRRVREYLK
jgi:hypothetical protein